MMYLKSWRIIAFLVLFFSFSLQANSDRCLELLQGLISTQERSERTIDFRSIADINPQILEQFIQLKPEPIDYTIFLNDFLRQHNRPPTLREAIEYSYEIRREMHEGYENLVQQLRSSDQIQIQNLSRELDRTLEGLPRFNDLNRLENDLEQRVARGENLVVTSLDDKMEIESRDGKIWFEENYYRFLRDKTGLGNYVGHYGEILIILQTPDRVIKRGLKFDVPFNEATDPYQKEIAQRVLELEARLRNMNIDQLKSLVEEHTLDDAGLLRFVKVFIDEADASVLNNADIVELIVQAVKSKEMDMISVSAQEKLIWSEVKAYSKPITVESLTKGSGKTLMEQLLEHRSVASLLGYGEEVQMRFYTPLTSVERDAQQLLESIGYQVNP